MAPLLLPNSCCYLLDHPDPDGGRGAGAMLCMQCLLAPGVAAEKEHLLCTTGVELDGELVALGSKAFGEQLREPLPLAAREEWNTKKEELKQKERSCTLGRERVFYLAVTCRLKKNIK